MATFGIFWGLNVQRVHLTLIQILEGMVTAQIKIF